MTIAEHANRISDQRFGSMDRPEFQSDGALEPTLATPAAFAAGIAFSIAIGCADVLK